MKLTLLVDLDDTLLSNQMELFEPAYLKALSKHLSNHVRPDVMLRELLSATRQMITNTQPDSTLETVFDQAFYPAIGTSKPAISAVIAQFYREVFPGLKGVTSPKPDAARFIEWAHKKGHRVVVATNPLFPHTAIDQRLAWAGFPIDQYHFDLITSYESFHFAKPNPFYIAEILAQLGWPDEPTIMIGNDAKDDISPAVQLGLATFWVNSQPANNQSLPVGVTRYGSLDDLIKWLDSNEGLAIQKETLTAPDSCLAILNANLSALLTLTNLWPDTHPEQLSNLIGYWCDIETMRNLPWIQQVLQEENPLLADHSPVPATTPIRDGKQALTEFSTARLSTIALLSHLTPQDWRRPLRHPTLGESNLAALISLIAGEDQVWMRRCWQVVSQHS